MLKTRVVTAVALLLFLITALFALPPTGWALLCGGITALGAWEWGGFLKFPQRARVLLGLAVVAYTALATLLLPAAVGAEGSLAEARWFSLFHYLPAAAFWILLSPPWLKNRWSLARPDLGLLVGLVVLLPTWLALVQLRSLGAVALIALMAVVWVADIAAYFSGRAFGGKKLAPQISPGKTWAGAYGAAVGVMVYGLTIRPLIPSLDSLPPLAWGLVLAALTAVSIVGDLFESLLKRQAGIKDSSNLLPGHGGILDRIDSLTSTMPLLALALLMYMA